MSYIPTIVVDDDNEDVLRNFRWERKNCNVNIETFITWDKTEEYIKSGNAIDAIVLDARGQITADDDVGDHHIMEALQFVKNAKIPYVIYTAHSEEELGLLKKEYQQGKVLDKAGARKKTEEDVINYLKKEIANSPQLVYPEPFACFGGKYLNIEYQELLKNIVLVLQYDEIQNAERFLFNPCRIILEQVFKAINNETPEVLPSALVNFEDQKVGLTNCSKYLNGVKVRVRYREYGRQKIEELQNRRFLTEHISQQIQTIIGVCHPASHEIQKRYSIYTFKSVLWALFDVLVWLKEFIDERS